MQLRWYALSCGPLRRRLGMLACPTPSCPHPSISALLICHLPGAGCRYAASLIDQLAESGSASLDAAANAEAWLQRAFQQLSTPQDPAFSSGEMQSCFSGSALCSSCAHPRA